MNAKLWVSVIAAVGAVAGSAYVFSGLINFGGSGNTQNNHSNNQTNSHNDSHNTTVYNIFGAALKSIGLGGADTGLEGRSAGVFSGTQGAQVIKLSAGLEAKLSSIGRSKDRTRVAVSVLLSNNGKETVLLALAGPTLALDNNGGRYTEQSASGVSLCPWRSDVQTCLTHPAVLSGMTQLDPGTQLSLDFALAGAESSGPLMSFSTTLVGRVVPDLDKDLALSDENKKKQIRSFGVSIQPTKVSEAQ